MCDKLALHNFDKRS